MKGILLRYRDMNKSNRVATPQMQKTRLSIVGMSCGACARHVTTVLKGLTGVLRVHIDLAKNEGVVDHLRGRIDETGLIAAIRDAGYQASVPALSREHGDLSSQPAPSGHSTGCCCG